MNVLRNPVIAVIAVIAENARERILRGGWVTTYRVYRVAQSAGLYLCR
jgi:hypothetical protein